jgi:hypothetical protein
MFRSDRNLKSLKYRGVDVRYLCEVHSGLRGTAPATEDEPYHR